MAKSSQLLAVPTTDDNVSAGALALSVSCLLDGELDAAERERVLDRLCSDSDARRLWVTMNVVGDAIRSCEVACTHRDDFDARVAQALLSEPTVLAPGRRRRLTLSVVLPGVALVAAAAMLTVVVVPLLRESPAESPAANTGLVSIDRTNPSMTAPTATADPSSGTAVANVRRPSNPYLQAHRELSAGPMLPPSTSYLRTSASVPAESAR